jgi:hypothetical protein
MHKSVRLQACARRAACPTAAQGPGGAGPPQAPQTAVQRNMTGCFAVWVEAQQDPGMQPPQDT